MVKYFVHCWALCALVLSLNVWADAPSELAIKDPTTPLKAQAGVAGPVSKQANTEQKFELTAIYRVSGRIKAVVNGQVVQVGERVNGALVKHIGANSVRLSGSEEIELRLMPAVIKNKNLEPQYVDAE